MNIIHNTVPIASTENAPPAPGVPACPTLSQKRLHKEWEDIIKGGTSKIPLCISIQLQDEDLFSWKALFSKKTNDPKGKGKAGPSQFLQIDLTFPKNYPFSPPHVTCGDFALFVPHFIPDWTPRMTIQTLLCTIIAGLDKISFPMNRIDISRYTPEEASFDSLGLTATNESSGKLILLCAKPLDKNDKQYWSVHVNKCTEIDIGVTTLWEGHNLMQYIWSYLEVGVVQQILLPEGPKTADNRKEKLNSYEYAAEELACYQAEPYTTGDIVSIFYNGVNQSLSFFKNGHLQYTFFNIFTEGQVTTEPSRPPVSRRSRRQRAIENELLKDREQKPTDHVPPSPAYSVSSTAQPRKKDSHSYSCEDALFGPVRGPTTSAAPLTTKSISSRSRASSRGSYSSYDNNSEIFDDLSSVSSGTVGPTISDTSSITSIELVSRRREGDRESPSGLLFPAVSLASKSDCISISFEPPLWSPDTHKFFPRQFTPLVLTCIYGLEKRHQLPRKITCIILPWVGVAFNTIHFP